MNDKYTVVLDTVQRILPYLTFLYRVIVSRDSFALGRQIGSGEVGDLRLFHATQKRYKMKFQRLSVLFL